MIISLMLLSETDGDAMLYLFRTQRRSTKGDVAAYGMTVSI